MRSLQLIVRGDDAGASVAANRGVVEACARGCLANVSVMAVGPALPALIGPLRDLGTRVCIGLHVTLNSEWSYRRWGPILPAVDVPSLVSDDGTFTRSPMDLYARGVTAHEMMLEVIAQLNVLRGAGLNVAYVDEHMGVGWLPGLREQIARLAEREGLIVAERFPHLLLPRSDHGTQRERYVAGITRWSTAASDGWEGPLTLVTHPEGADDDGDAAADPPTEADHRRRRHDLAFLIDPSTRAVLAERNVTVVTYAEAARISSTDVALV